MRLKPGVPTFRQPMHFPFDEVFRWQFPEDLTFTAGHSILFTKYLRMTIVLSRNPSMVRGNISEEYRPKYQETWMFLAVRPCISWESPITDIGVLQIGTQWHNIGGNVYEFIVFGIFWQTVVVQCMSGFVAQHLKTFTIPTWSAKCCSATWNSFS